MAYLITIVLIASVRLIENAISGKNGTMENPHSNFVEEYPAALNSPKTDRFQLHAPPGRGKGPGHPKEVSLELKNASLFMGKKTLKGGFLSAGDNATNVFQSLRRSIGPDGSELDGLNQAGEVIEDMTKRPYLASVRMRNTHLCGGTLIDVQWVLTAASCVQFSVVDMSVLAGTPQIYQPPVEDGMMQLRLVETAISHDNFIENQKLNNIALIKVKRPFILTRWVNVLPIPWVPDLNPNVVCTTCNWASIDNARFEHLICQPITFMNQETCAQQPFLAGMSGHVISCNILCSLARVVDSRISQISNGGPVVCQGKGAGILFTSNILDTSVHRFFTRIGPFMVFITKHIQNIQPQPIKGPPANSDLISTLLKGFKLRLNVTLTGKFCLPDAA